MPCTAPTTLVIPGARVGLVFDAMLPPTPGQPINFAEAGYMFFRRS